MKQQASPRISTNSSPYGPRHCFLTYIDYNNLFDDRATSFIVYLRVVNVSALRTKRLIVNTSVIFGGTLYSIVLQGSLQILPSKAISFFVKNPLNLVTFMRGRYGLKYIHSISMQIVYTMDSIF